MTADERRTAALLFADMEGSTKLLAQLGDGYVELLAEYHRILGGAVSTAGGETVGTEGDGLFAAFPAASGAIEAAIAAQRGLAEGRWPGGATVRARMGLHVGEIRPVATGYVGMAVHLAARVAASAHGGQVLATAALAGLIGRSLPSGVVLRDLGEHELKDIDGPERLFQIDVDGLPNEFPPPRGTGGRRHNLKSALTSFVGRDEEAAEIEDLLDRNRLVTLIGAGGAGKTRLAVHVAERQLGAYRDGVWLTELAEIADPEQVPAAVAHSVGVREPRSGEIVDQLRGRLEPAEMLLVVDNCEQVLGPVAALLGEVLPAARGVTVLATSRESLGIAGEVAYRVPSLGVPRGSVPAVEARDAPAVRLFLDRAAAARPGLVIDDDGVAAVVEICGHLDGIPLALELAAARLGLLTPRQLVDRLDDALTVLGTGGQSAPTRHRTLGATLDWSHDLLSEREQIVLRRLGVFTGGFTLEAAEEVCAAGSISSVEVFEALDRLVASSVVAHAAGGGPRYAMLRTVRFYARRRLDAAGEMDSVAARHAEFFRRMVRGGGERLNQRDQARWLDGLEADHDNLRAALRWALHDANAVLATDLAGDLTRFWYRHGYFAEARRWITEVLGLPQPDPSPGLANVLRFAAATDMDAGDVASAQAMADRAAAVARELGAPALVARSLNVRAGIAWRLGDLDVALSRYREAVDVLGDDPFRTRLRVNMADLLLDMGRLDDAEETLSQIVAEGGEVGSVDTAFIRAGIHFGRGDLAAAEQILEDATVELRELGLLPNLASALRKRAAVAREAGHIEEARAFADEGAALFREVDDPLNAVDTEVILAGLAVDAGERDQARAPLAAAIRRFQQASRRSAVHGVVVEYRALAAADADWRRWARLDGAAGTLAAALPTRESEAQRIRTAQQRARAGGEIGEELVLSESAAGAGMTFDEIVSYASAG